LDSPKKIYEFPASKFVATFVGSSNLIEGTLRIRDGIMQVEVEALGTFGVYYPVEKTWMISGRKILMSVRPEKLLITKSAREGFSNHLTGKVVDIIYYGRSTEYRVQVANGQLLMVFEQNEEHFPQETIDYDDVVNVYFQKENVVLLEY
ncbi:TOBE domain-containing protein, partial [Candidatus Dependentiae bacterium]|nr:TOBE domain-containing protein [Candidatus Dependentiae bacterium]